MIAEILKKITVISRCYLISAISFLIAVICYSILVNSSFAQEKSSPFLEHKKFRAKVELDGKPLYLQSSIEPRYDNVKKCHILRAISYKGKDPIEGFVIYEVGIDEKDGRILFTDELKLPYAPVEAFKKSYSVATQMIKSYHPNYKTSMYYWDYISGNYRLIVFYRPEAMTIDAWYCQVDVNSKDGAIVAKAQGLYK